MSVIRRFHCIEEFQTESFSSYSVQKLEKEKEGLKSVGKGFDEKHSTIERLEEKMEELAEAIKTIRDEIAKCVES